MDCDPRSCGCEGGWCERAFEWVIYNGGITSEVQYPYKAIEGPCQVKDSIKSIIDYKRVPSYSVQSLKIAVSRQPVTAYIPVGHRFLSLKAGAVHNGEDFSSSISLDPLDDLPLHAVLIVGYDKSPNGTEFFIVKNSWGGKWADKGYGFVSANLVVTGEMYNFLYPIMANYP